MEKRLGRIFKSPSPHSFPRRNKRSVEGGKVSLPDERYRSVSNAREFLRSLLDPKLTPKVPKSLRHQAYWILKHFPSDADMRLASKDFAKVFDFKKKI